MLGLCHSCQNFSFRATPGPVGPRQLQQQVSGVSTHSRDQNKMNGPQSRGGSQDGDKDLHYSTPDYDQLLYLLGTGAQHHNYKRGLLARKKDKDDLISALSPQKSI